MTERIDVFISYKREERGLADAVSRALQRRGYTAVTDIDIGAGEHFGAAIDRMIRAARAVVVLWTPGAAGSQWVQDEARLAIELDTYLGVLLETADLPVDIRYRQCLDLTGEPLGSGGADRVAAAVACHVGEPSADTDRAKGRTQRLNDELMLFQAVERNATIEAYQAFLKSFPDGALAPVADAQIRHLTNWRTRLRNTLPSLGALGLLVGLGSLWVDYLAVLGRHDAPTEGMQSTTTEAMETAASRGSAAGSSVAEAAPRPSGIDTQSRVREASTARQGSLHCCSGLSLTSNGRSVWVSGVTRDSLADRRGLKRGDVLEIIGGLEVNTLSEVERALAARSGSNQVAFKYRRHGTQNRGS